MFCNLGLLGQCLRGCRCQKPKPMKPDLRSSLIHSYLKIIVSLPKKCLQRGRVNLQTPPASPDSSHFQSVLCYSLCLLDWLLLINFYVDT